MMAFSTWPACVISANCIWTRPTFTVRGLAFLEVLRHPSLLNLAHTDIDNSTAVLLGRLRSLKSLVLERTGITDEGLAPISELRNLCSLDLRHVEDQITDIGMASSCSWSRSHLRAARILACSASHVSNECAWSAPTSSGSIRSTRPT